jgi:hypothetical protein
MLAAPVRGADRAARAAYQRMRLGLKSMAIAAS